MKASREDALTQLRVAKNCPASWPQMSGDDRVRHCGQCSRNVYNIANMTQAEATDLIESAEGWLCVRFYRRIDGKVMTKDCPKPIRAITRLQTAILSVIAFFGFSVVSPVYAGQTKMTPEQHLRHLRRKASNLTELIESEKNPEARAELKEHRETIFAEMRTLGPALVERAERG